MADPYKRLRVLGRGATAHVWLAEGPEGLVALKVAHQAGHLRREIALLRQLRHPSIARLVASDDDGDWLALEHAPNGTAAEWAPGQPLTQLVEFAARLAEGLEAVHQAGYVHGDVKPGNVLVAADHTPRLVDMGSATKGRRSSETGATPGYAAPERLRSGPPTVAGDLWSLGAVLYMLLTRRPPFPGDDPATLTWAPLATLPEPPGSIRPRLPSALEDLVLQLLAHRPEARPASAGRVAEELRASMLSGMRPPLVGMGKARDLLRRTLVDLMGGGRSMVVLHGATGSGRKALIREVIAASRREGVRVILPGDGDAILKDLATEEPAVLAMDGGAVGSEELLLQLLRAPASALILVRSDRPMLALARRGARHIQPPPLSLDEVTFLIDALDLDRHRAETVHRRSGGLPGAVQGILTPILASSLTPLAQSVLQNLRSGALTVPVLARRLALGEHRLLDLVEPMIDRGLVVASADGVWLSVPR